LELRVIVVAGPGHEFAEGFGTDFFTAPADPLALFDSLQALGGMEAEEYHRVAAFQDLISPAIDAAGEHPGRTPRKNFQHQLNAPRRVPLLGVGRIGGHPEVVIRIRVRHRPGIGDSPAQCGGSGPAATHNM